LQTGAFKYVFCKSSPSISNEFKDAMRREMQTLLLKTTLAYAIELGGSVMCHPTKNLALQVKSILISKIM
jgi:hypothetical protein